MGALSSPQKDSCNTGSFCVLCAMCIKVHLIHNKEKGKLPSFMCHSLACPWRTPPYLYSVWIFKKHFFLSYTNPISTLFCLIPFQFVNVLSSEIAFPHVRLIYNFMSDHKLCHQLQALVDGNLAVKTFLYIGRPSINLSNNICCIFNGKIPAIIRL